MDAAMACAHGMESMIRVCTATQARGGGGRRGPDMAEIHCSYANFTVYFLPGPCPSYPPCPLCPATSLVRYGTYGVVWNVVPYRVSYCASILRVISIAGATVCNFRIFRIFEFFCLGLGGEIPCFARYFCLKREGGTFVPKD